MAIDDRADVLPDAAPSTALRPGAPTRRALRRRRSGAAAVELTAELVAIDSVNPGLVPGAAGEAADRRAPAEPAAAQRVHHPRRHRRRGTTTARAWSPSARRTTPGPTVVLTGHLDTVGVEGMPDPFTPTVEATASAGVARAT